MRSRRSAASRGGRNSVNLLFSLDDGDDDDDDDDDNNNGGGDDDAVAQAMKTLETVRKR